MSKPSDRWEKVKLVLHVCLISTILIGSGTWLTYFLVSTLGDQSMKKQKPQGGTIKLGKVVYSVQEKVKRRLGELSFAEPKLKGHFHHIGEAFEMDTWNFCIDCHGAVPHSKNIDIRSFLNMHTMFVSCQVCHVQIEEPESGAQTNFGWIDLKKGKLQPNPDMENAVWGEYGVKIIQLVGSGINTKPLFMAEERTLHNENKNKKSKLNKTQKVILNKLLHKRCSDEPVKCAQCHKSDTPLLPYRALGYLPDRQDYLVNAEVVDLVERYETFFMPSLLEPDKANLDSTGSD